MVELSRDTAGIQAQVMSAAELALWTRGRHLTRDTIRAALWNDRSIVKTTVMRRTLHLIPADDFAMYISALQPTATATLQRILTRVRAKPGDVARFRSVVMDALEEGPQTQQELIKRAAQGAGRGMRAWLKYSWVAVRPLVIDGSICYGPPRGTDATFVRTDRWLPPQRRIGAEDARAELMRRFLAAFGPATAHDFAKWSGLRIPEAKAAIESLEDEVVRVTVDGAHAWALGRDLDEIADGRLNAGAVKLLGPFDTLLLAHATKEHLVGPRFYKRVYRPQGWISPVVLVGERVVAVWFSKTRGKTIELDVQPFGRLDRRVGAAIESEADALARFLGSDCVVRVRAV